MNLSTFYFIPSLLKGIWILAILAYIYGEKKNRKKNKIKINNMQNSFSTRDELSNCLNKFRKLLTDTQTKTPWLELYSYVSYLNIENIEQIASELNNEDKLHLFEIASLNHDGYLREKALTYLAKFETSDAFPYILMRLNDWVPEVRVSAQQALVKNLQLISATEVIKYRSLIEWLERTNRTDLKIVQHKIFEHFYFSHNTEEILSSIKKFKDKDRLFFWKSLNKIAICNDDLINSAIKDSFVEIRMQVAKNLPDNKLFKERLYKLFSDKSSRVRYMALISISKNKLSEYKILFEQAIFDESSKIREYSRFVIKMLGYDDEYIAKKYRDKYNKDQINSSIGTISGLFEIGKKDDAHTILSFINHKNHSIRSAALYGLNRLSVEKMDNIYINGLNDKNAKVRKTSVKILQNNYKHLNDDLFMFLQKSTNVKAKKSALKVLTHYSPLEFLYGVLIAIFQMDAKLSPFSWNLLNSWHRYFSTKLWFSFNSNTYDKITKLLDDVKNSSIKVPLTSQKAYSDLPIILNILKGKN